jgi:hypothetical protein
MPLGLAPNEPGPSQRSHSASRPAITTSQSVPLKARIVTTRETSADPQASSLSPRIREPQPISRHASVGHRRVVGVADVRSSAPTNWWASGGVVVVAAVFSAAAVIAVLASLAVLLRRGERASPTSCTVWPADHTPRSVRPTPTSSLTRAAASGCTSTRRVVGSPGSSDNRGE